MNRSKTTRPNKCRRDKFRFRAFAQAYLAIGQKTYFNAYQSALAAGYAKNTAKGESHKFLDHPSVRAEMEAIRANRAAQSTIASPEEVLEVITAQMRTTPEIFVDENGGIIPLKAGEKSRAIAVVGIKERSRTIMAGEDAITEKVLEYKLIDRLKAAVELAKHHGLFEKDNAQQKPDPAQVQIVNSPPIFTLEQWEKEAEAAHQRMIAKKKPSPPQGEQ
jgi:phage terminase small subunit